jgi:predicted amidohydrolase YtcJ
MRFGLNAEIFRQRQSVTNRELLASQYGERLNTMQPVKDLIAKGYAVHIEGGGPHNHPMWLVEKFVTRIDDAGRVWGKDQAVDRQTALRMLTYNAARFMGEEQSLGSLEPGKLADMAVVGGDFMGIAAEKISTLPIKMTIVDGKVVYEGGPTHSHE